MKKSASILLVFFFLVLSSSLTGQTQDHPGKKIFMDSKCQTCHSIESQNLTTKAKKSVDLSNVGAIYRANFLEKYLMKQEKLNDKQHPQAFKGSNEDLHQLAEFLQTLNTGETTGKTGKTDTTKVKSDTKTGTKKDTTDIKKK
jgi:cytochrome c553